MPARPSARLAWHKARMKARSGQGHLAGSVGRQRNARVGAADLQVGVGDGGHLELVVAADDELGEAGRERNLPAGGQAHGRAEIMFCSAMRASKYRCGNFLANISAKVEFFTSPSRATMRVVGAQGRQGHRRTPCGVESLLGSRALSMPAALMASPNGRRRNLAVSRPSCRRAVLQLGRAVSSGVGHAQFGGLGVQVGHRLRAVALRPAACRGRCASAAPSRPSP